VAVAADGVTFQNSLGVSGRHRIGRLRSQLKRFHQEPRPRVSNMGFCGTRSVVQTMR